LSVSHECFVGEEFTLKVTILPANAIDKTVTWTSSDNTKATVDNTGKVSAIAEGDVVITVTSNLNNRKDDFDLKIKPVAVTGISLDKTIQKLYIDDEFTLTATVEPANATYKTVRSVLMQVFLAI
jgi:uncharacterized protein YjdB